MNINSFTTVPMQTKSNTKALTADDIREIQQQNAQTAMQFSSEEAEKNRQWQEQMSNTAYQRAVEDMKKAGLNPVLALGEPATTPNGAMAQSTKADTYEETKLDKMMDFVSNIVSTAMNLKGTSMMAKAMMTKRR